MAHQQHEHVAAAEKDDDGMWEAACEHCGILAGPVFQAVLPRRNTEAEAIADATAIFMLAEHGDGAP